MTNADTMDITTAAADEQLDVAAANTTDNNDGEESASQSTSTTATTVTTVTKKTAGGGKKAGGVKRKGSLSDGEGVSAPKRGKKAAAAAALTDGEDGGAVSDGGAKPSKRVKCLQVVSVNQASKFLGAAYAPAPAATTTPAAASGEGNGDEAAAAAAPAEKAEECTPMKKRKDNCIAIRSGVPQQLDLFVTTIAPLLTEEHVAKMPLIPTDKDLKLTFHNKFFKDAGADALFGHLKSGTRNELLVPFLKNLLETLFVYSADLAIHNARRTIQPKDVLLAAKHITLARFGFAYAPSEEDSAAAAAETEEAATQQ